MPLASLVSSQSKRDPPGAVAQLGRHGGRYAGAVALQVLAQAAALPLLTRALDPGEFGLLATALVVANLLAVTVDAGLARSVTRRFFLGLEGAEAARSLIAPSLLVVATLSAAVHAVGPVWSGVFSSVPYEAPLQLAVAVGACMAVRNVVVGLLRAQQRSAACAVIMALSTAGAQAAGLLALLIQTSVTQYLTGLLVGVAVTGAIGIALVRPTLAGRGPTGLRWAFAFGLLSVPVELAAVALWFADRVVVERLLDLDAVARYQLAYTIGSVLLMVAMSVSQAWSPVLHARVPEERRAAAAATHAALCVPATLGIGSVALLAPVALLLAAPDTYRPRELTVVSVLIAASVLPLLAQQAASHLLADAQRTRPLAAAAVLAVLTNLILTVALVPPFGLEGAAAATLLTYVFYAWVVVHLEDRHARLVLAPVTGPTVLAGSAAALGLAMPAAGPWLLLRVVLGASCCLLLWSFGRRTLGRPPSSTSEKVGGPL